MRSIKRPTLSPSTLAKLASLTERFVNDPEPKVRAEAKWAAKPKKVFAEIKAVLEGMAPGKVATWL